MSDLKFYDVDNEYLNYLKNAEIDSRGFTKVPYNNYENNNKFVCGVVLDIKGFKYYAPVSSYKESKEDNICIKNKKGYTLGTIRFNYMFPVPYSCLKEKIIDNIEDDKYKSLLQKEYAFCIKNKEVICNKAKRTYKKVTLKLNPQLIKNSCDFKLLEQKCLEYIKLIDSELEVAPSKEMTEPKEVKHD